MEKGYFRINKKWPEMGQFLSGLIDSLPAGSVVLWDNSFFRRDRGWTWDRAVKYVTKKWPDKHHALPFWVRYDPASKVRAYLGRKLPKLDDPKAMGRLYAYAGLEATLPMLTGQATRYPDEFYITGAPLQYLWNSPGICSSACLREEYIHWSGGSGAFYTELSDEYLISAKSYFSRIGKFVFSEGLVLYFANTDSNTSQATQPKVPIHMAYPAP